METVLVGLLEGATIGALVGGLVGTAIEPTVGATVLGVWDGDATRLELLLLGASTVSSSPGNAVFATIVLKYVSKHANPQISFSKVVSSRPEFPLGYE